MGGEERWCAVHFRKGKLFTVLACYMAVHHTKHFIPVAFQRHALQLLIVAVLPLNRWLYLNCNWEILRHQGLKNVKLNIQSGYRLLYSILYIYFYIYFICLWNVLVFLLIVAWNTSFLCTCLDFGWVGVFNLNTFCCVYNFFKFKIPILQTFLRTKNTINKRRLCLVVVLRSRIAKALISDFFFFFMENVKWEVYNIYDIFIYLFLFYILCCNFLTMFYKMV